MSDLDARLRALGPVSMDDDGEGEPWLEVEPGKFRYVTFALSGPTPVGAAFDRADVESHCGRLVPLPD
jgi:hypothetical protein